MTDKPNFGNILDQQVSTVVPPPLLPVAKYILFVKEMTKVESRQKNTPGIEFRYGVKGPAPGENPDLTDPRTKEPIDLSKKVLRETFWTTPDALPRLRKHLEEHLGIDIGTMTFSEVLNNYTKGAECIGDVTQELNQKTQEMFNTISNFAKL